jgi:hypothetical protein
VIRRLTGDSFVALVSREIAQPLGLRDTGVVPSAEQRARLARGLVASLFGLHPALHVYSDSLSGTYDWSEGSSGALFSTGRDLATFAQGLFAGKLLDPASLAELTTVRRSAYGLGLGVARVGTSRQTLYWHNGVLTPLGYQAFVGYFPAESAALVILANVDEQVIDLTEVVMATLHGRDFRHPPRLSGDRAEVTARVLHLGLVLAIGGYLLALLRTRKRQTTWPQVLIAASGAFLGASAGLLWSPSWVHVLGCLAGTALSVWMLVSGRRAGAWQFRDKAARRAALFAVHALVLGAALVVLRLVR